MRELQSDTQKADGGYSVIKSREKGLLSQN